MISVFYCYVANYHKISGLKQHPFIISHFRRSEVWTQLGSLLNGLTRLKRRCKPDWWFLIWRLWGIICFQAHSSCWQNSLPCGCWTDIPFPCWLSGGPLSASVGLQHSLAHDAFYFQSQQLYINFFSWFESLWFPLCYYLEKTILLKGMCD